MAKRVVLTAALLLNTSSVFAQVQIPPEVESQAQIIDEKFASTLSEECGSKLCAPVGCEIVRFRTLDQAQNASLPGLDMSEEEEPGPLQFKLEALRCEFVYEPTLPTEAIASLRQRLSAKVRQAGVNVSVTGRKLSAASPAFKNAPKDASPFAPVAQQDGFTNAVNQALPAAIWITLITLGLAGLIWSFRRLGKPRPTPIATIDADNTMGEQTKTDENAGPSAITIIAKREHLKTVLTSDDDLAQLALTPLAVKSEKDELCRVLQHFGPQPLAAISQKPEYRDLFAEVRKKYESENREESNAVVAAFLDKVERLVALAQLGRPESTLEDEFAFLREFSSDEFAQLVSGLQSDEVMAILSFVPAGLRAQFLQRCTTSFVETYVQYVVQNPRVPDFLVRQVARKMREDFVTRHSEIKSVSREQLPLLEQVLNSLNGEKRLALIKRLRVEQPMLFDKLMSETFFDRSLVNVPEATLNDIFLRLTPEEAAAYLNGHPDRQAVLAKLKAPLAASVRNQGQFGPTRIGLNLDFVETESPLAQAARVRLNDVVREKAASGEINLRRINESVMASV